MYPVTSMKINPCPRKVNMIDKIDYLKNAQEAVYDCVETLLDWGNTAIDNSFSMYEQGIAAQESSIAEARKQFQELESNLTQNLYNQRKLYKSMALELSEAYWPESKQLIEQPEKLNLNEVFEKNREMLESNIDTSLKTNLDIEKKSVAQLRKNYARGAENVRKQFNKQKPQAAVTTAANKSKATKK